jgi:hypothetical protein
MNLEDIKIDDSKITEEQLEALYIYLSMTYDTMDEEEKKAWHYIMKKIDNEFHEQD